MLQRKLRNPQNNNLSKIRITVQNNIYFLWYEDSSRICTTDDLVNPNYVKLG